MRRFRLPSIVPLLAVLALVMLAATPVFDISARDGKARAIASGELDVEAMQEAAVEEGLAKSDAAALPIGGAECTNGFAGPYPCENVDLEAIVHTTELDGATGADVWGWTDPQSGREIAIPTTTYGMAFVDVTKPSEPVILGRVYVGWEQEDDDVLWRDVKVYEDHAFLVSEHEATNLIIFDLTRLRGVTSDEGTFDPDVVWEGTEERPMNSAHNIAINTDTGYAYVVGGDSCDGGLHIVDINDPKNPQDAGCFDADGYTHDVQCVIYEGPDTEHHGKEICFASNEDTLTVVDVTDKSSPVLLSRTPYPTASYTHQGWLTEDQRWFLFGDELDEMFAEVVGTTTYIADFSDLDGEPTEKNPDGQVPVTSYTHDTLAIDHNMYVRDNYVSQANYSAGLRIMEFTDESLSQPTGQLSQAAFFDVDPGPDAPVFAGAWTAYPYFESGTVALNSFDSGLFVLSTELFAPADGGDDDGEDSDRCGQDGDDRKDDGKGRDGDERRDDRCGDDDGEGGRGRGGSSAAQDAARRAIFGIA